VWNAKTGTFLVEEGVKSALRSAKLAPKPAQTALNALRKELTQSSFLLSSSSSSFTPSFLVCHDSGYEKAPGIFFDGATCEDINECDKGTEVCGGEGSKQECVNTVGSFECRCLANHVRNADGHCIDPTAPISEAQGVEEEKPKEEGSKTPEAEPTSKDEL